MRESQSNSRFNALDTLVVTVHSVKMPVGFDKRAIKSMGRPLSVMAHLRQSIVEVNTHPHAHTHTHTHTHTQDARAVTHSSTGNFRTVHH